MPEARVRVRSLTAAGLLAVVGATAFAQTTAGATSDAAAFAPRGPYAVGFRVTHEYDHSRTTGPRRDFEGRERPDEISYPMQIRVWYPASGTTASGPRMMLGDYMVLGAQKEDPRPITAGDSTSEITGLKGFARFALRLDITDAEAEVVFAREMAAVRDAPVARGRFPVLVAGTDGGTATAASLFELLASHGYVVIASASLPSLGALQVSARPRAIDIRIRDFEYLVAHARAYPFVDHDRIGVVGVNFDGMPALLMQMKNMRATAVLSIDGWEGKRFAIESVRSSVHFDPLRMRVPYFLVLQDEANPPPDLTHDYSIVDALRYGATEILVIRHLDHAFLAGQGIDFPQAASGRQAGYALLMRRVLNFADRYVKSGSAGSPLPADSLTKVDRRRPPLRPVPYAEELERVLMEERGAERLRAIFRAARQENPDVRLFSQSALNLFAFRFSRTDRMPEALMLLELGVEADPGSTAAHNDLGNLRLQAGDTTRALEAFIRALEVLPSDTSFTDSARATSRTVIERKIDRLRRRPETPQPRPGARATVTAGRRP